MKTKVYGSSKIATSKEAYRLWFEFLKRAIANPNVKVNTKHYKAWGDVSKYKFDAWWKEIGSKVIDLDGQSNVSFATDGVTEDGSYLVRVPKTLTSTEAQIADTRQAKFANAICNVMALGVEDGLTQSDVFGRAK